MEPSRQVNEEQAALWNGPSGRAWIEAQQALDRMFEPIERLLVEALGDGTRRVLDVGCGTGSTTLAIARRLGAHGQCTGVDISQPMIGVARERAAREGSPARFLCADAQSHTFEAGAFDRLVSRFGVMFFDDPAGAFANLRCATRAGGTLDCIVWRTAAENSFMTTAERAAAPLLPDLPARKPAVGQFAFADPRHVEAVVGQGGWGAIAVEPVDVECTLTEAALMHCLTWIGPVGRVLQDADATRRRQVVDAMRPAFDPYVHDGEVRFTAACWRILARSPSP